MNHVVLLGDSIFDNAAYVAGGPDVVAQLRALLPSGWRATNRAIDGDVIAGVARQLRDVPADATHLAVSVGGNDALGWAGVLEERAGTVGAGLERLTEVRDAFRRDYAAMLDAVAARRLPFAVCTIYDPRYPDAELRRLLVTALALLNDVILREAAGRGLPVLDLRLVCGADADFANPIEPSEKGGAKIAGAIAAFVGGSGGRRSLILSG